jgi:hypothetical protein
MTTNERRERGMVRVRVEGTTEEVSKYCREYIQNYHPIGYATDVDNRGTVANIIRLASCD